ncbi:hypothetical protein F5Y12DRAFT_772588 [Xylaria sp. FL1777]|nr:hypothetical protein F5Y12DRAFT_772588 [Xylaria sp. FL1777]
MVNQLISILTTYLTGGGLWWPLILLCALHVNAGYRTTPVLKLTMAVNPLTSVPVICNPLLAPMLTTPVNRTLLVQRRQYVMRWCFVSKSCQGA